MRRRWWFRLSILVVDALCIFSLVNIQRAAGQTSIRPVALGFSKGGDLFELDATGKISLFAVSAQRAESRVIAEFAASWEPVDLVVTQLDGEDHLFVTLTQGNLSQLMHYSGEGKFYTSWFQFAPLSGVCADENSVYVSSWSGGFLYRQPFSAAEKSSPKPLFRLPSARSLGALAWDPVGKVIFVADVQAGDVYTLDPQDLKWNLLSQNLGQVTALTYDSRRRRLYIADAGGRKIWMIDTQAKKTKPVVAVASDRFRVPSAVAIGSDGSIWIGDSEAHAIFQFLAGAASRDPSRVIQ